MNAHRFPIGTRYLSSGKHSRGCTVLDQLTTSNAAGEVVSRNAANCIALNLKPSPLL